MPIGDCDSAQAEISAAALTANPKRTEPFMSCTPKAGGPLVVAFAARGRFHRRREAVATFGWF